MKRPLASARCDEDRNRIGFSEELNRGVDVLRIDQPGNAELNLGKAFAIGHYGFAIVAPHHHPSVVTGVEGMFGGYLEVEDVDRVLRSRENFGRIDIGQIDHGLTRYAACREHNWARRQKT
jgi:hypothetical protein